MKQYHQSLLGLLIGLLAAGLLFIINRPNYGEPIILLPAPTPTRTTAPRPTSTKAPIIAQIKGEILNPGVYEIQEDYRLGDLINAAGGLTENADENLINYALVIRDGDYIFIPAEGQNIPDIARNSSINTPFGQEVNIQFPININEATQEDLELLPGIGPAKAADIIEYRQMIGAFTSLDELLEVNGIGPATLESLLDYLICDP